MSYTSVEYRSLAEIDRFADVGRVAETGRLATAFLPRISLDGKHKPGNHRRLHSNVLPTSLRGSQKIRGRLGSGVALKIEKERGSLAVRPFSSFHLFHFHVRHSPSSCVQFLGHLQIKIFAGEFLIQDENIPG